MPPRPLALITGASAGLGASFAIRAARDGHDLLLVARRLDHLESVAEPLRRAYGICAECRSLDLTNRAALTAFCSEIDCGRLQPDVLVNNAGFAVGGSYAAADAKQIAALFDLNVTASAMLLRAVLPGMIARGGRIINVASLAGGQPGPGNAAYAAAKACFTSLSEAVAFETRRTAVKVLTLCPGPIDTPFAEIAGLSKTWLFSGVAGLEQPDRIADLAWRRVSAGSAKLIPGLMPKLLALATPISPRAVVLRAAALLFSSQGRGARAGTPSTADTRSNS